jgi:hypothetical protein
MSENMQLTFFKKQGYSLRSGRMKGRLIDWEYEYRIKCCEKMDVFFKDMPLELNIKVEVMGDLGREHQCSYHSYTDLVLQRQEEAKMKVKFAVAKVHGGSGSFSLAFHKPFHCMCSTHVKFSNIRDSEGCYSILVRFKVV